MKTYPAKEITVGYHPAGFRIDKICEPVNRYTKWKIDDSNQWKSFIPVCFHELPESGWIKVEKFNWES